MKGKGTHYPDSPTTGSCSSSVHVRHQLMQPRLHHTAELSQRHTCTTTGSIANSAGRYPQSVSVRCRCAHLETATAAKAGWPKPAAGVEAPPPVPRDACHQLGANRTGTPRCLIAPTVQVAAAGCAQPRPKDWTTHPSRAICPHPALLLFGTQPFLQGMVVARLPNRYVCHLHVGLCNSTPCHTQNSLQPSCSPYPRKAAADCGAAAYTPHPGTPARRAAVAPAARTSTCIEANLP